MTMPTFRWRAAMVIPETPEAVTIVFDAPGDFTYRPGQFVNVTLEIDGEPITRSYSLSSAPGIDERPAITVKQVPGGRMSTYLVAHAREIAQWYVSGPYGSFYLEDDVLLAHNLVLIAGGSGITPVFSMLKYYLRHVPGAVTLIYSNKDHASTIFTASLRTLEQAYGGRLKVFYFFTRSAAADAPVEPYATGRISPLLLKKIIKKQLGALYGGTHYYLCGPGGLIQEAEQVLQSLPVPSEFIHKEYFAPPAPAQKVAFPDTTLEALLHYYEQTNLLEVLPGKTILEAALQDKIPLPYSCKSGTCGVCAGRLVKGSVHMEKNFALSDALLERGYVLLCQSHPLDNEVTLEIP